MIAQNEKEGNVERLVGEATRASYLADRSNEFSMAPERKRGLDNGALLSGRGIPSEAPLSGELTWNPGENPRVLHG